MARQAISDNYTISSNRVTHAMVDEAQRVLENLINISTVGVFNEQLLQLFAILPRKMTNVSDFLAFDKADFPQIISKEQDLLDVMKGQVIQKAIEDKNNEVSGTETIHQKTILESMGLIFAPCSHEDIRIIKDSLKENAYRFRRAWKVTNIKSQEKFDNFI